MIATCYYVIIRFESYSDFMPMPWLTAAGNTQAPCVMIGEKVADMIALEYGLTLQS